MWVKTIKHQMIKNILVEVDEIKLGNAKILTVLKEEEISAELEKSKMNLKERLGEITLKIEETQTKFYETENETKQDEESEKYQLKLGK